jgi:acetyltransferase-like isoleucine patch superfamily enzyme
MTMFDPTTDPLLREILERFAGELMSDVDWARLYGLPEGCRIRERTKILAPEKLKCGKHLWIGEGAVLDAHGGLEIGDYTQIGLGVMIWSHSNDRQTVAGETGVSGEGIEYRPTRIGSRVFIAGPSVVLAGVTIGDGAIIEPLTLVDRDIAAGEVFGTARQMRALERRIQVLEEAEKYVAEAWDFMREIPAAP